VPTYELLPRFVRDLARLTPGQRAALRASVARFVADLEAQRGFRPGLRVKAIRGSRGVYEMTWAPDGRATFQYGEPVRPGEVHVVWRRVGTHDVFDLP